METRQTRFWLVFVTALMACFWIGFERLFVPRWSLQQGLLFCLLFGLLGLILTSPKFYKRFVGEATPATLGMIRIIACTCMLIIVLWIEDVPTTALFPEAMRSPMGVIEYFHRIPGFYSFTRSQSALQIFEWLTALCLFLGLIGWKTRIMVALGALGGCLIGGITRQYLFSFYHQGLVPVYILAILALTPCGDGLSVDRLIKIYRGQPVPDADRPLPIYAWSRYACWVFLVMAYMMSGTSKFKMSGIGWLNPINLQGMMYGCTLQRCNNYDWDLSLRWGSHLPDAVYFLFGLVGTVGEIAFITVLFFQLARWIMPPLMVALHAGILFFQNIIFVEFVLLQLMFINYTKVRQAIAQRIQSKHNLIQVFYDGTSPACCRSVRLLHSFDLFKRLKFTDIHQPDLIQPYQTHGLNLTLENRETDLFILAEGRSHVGLSAYRVLVRTLPALWWMLPFLSIPMLAPIGKWLHSHLLLNYFPLTAEQTQPPSKSKQLAGTCLPAPFRGTGNLRYPLLISLLIVILSACWFYRFYFYPLTGLHLFAYSDVSGVVVYNKIYATNMSNETFRIYPEDIIQAQSVASPRRVTNLCFRSNPDRVRICDAYLEALGTVHNNTSNPEKQFKQLEVQQWRWDFLENPSDSNYGQVIARHVLKIQL